MLLDWIDNFQNKKRKRAIYIVFLRDGMLKAVIINYSKETNRHIVRIAIMIERAFFKISIANVNIERAIKQ